MVQKPKSRRSRPTRKPVTIDLEASKPEPAPPGDAPAAEPVAFGREASGEPAAPVDEQVFVAGSVNSEPAGDEETGLDDAARGVVESGEQPITADATDAAPQPAAKPARGGILHAIGGGLVGGVAALAVAGGLQWAGIIGSPGSAPVDLSPLQARIDNLSAEVTALRDEAAAPAIPADVTGRIDTAEATAKANTDALQALQGDLSSLADRVTALNEALSSGSAGDGAGMEALSQRMTSLESKLSGLATAQPSAGGEEVAAIRSEIGAAIKSASEAKQGAAGLKTDLETLGQALDTLQSRVAKVESDIASGAGSRVAAAIAASALKSAADRGGGFMSELEAYATVASSPETVAALREYAASGVPTVSQLNDRFPEVANRIVAASSGVSPDAGIFDRLEASARSLVKIRPVGEVEGDGPGEIAARMEVALQKGDLARAIGEWEKLPDAPRAVSADFVSDLRARRELDGLISNVLTGAIGDGAADTSK